MSAQANLVAYDGAATPVAHTLVGIGTSQNLGISGAEWREQVVSLPIAAQVRALVRARLLKNDVYQVQTTVVVPVMESISGQNAAGYTAAPKVAYENTVVITGYYHKRASIAERRLVRQLAINIAGNISTSVAASTTGPVPELMDQNISPT